ncbi:hypothetical protein OG741_33225 [Streptomyces sp. NBC_01410]|uniref:hypothetical protein n=1 Tax=Streptomyces sp. NBC_01410 TaxID=2903856 RepID=UPI00324D8258
MNLSVVLAVVLGLALLGAVAALILTERKTPAAAPPRRPASAHVKGREALDAIDLGLRKLAAGCVRAGRALPDVYAVVYSGEHLTLRLAGADPDAPEPWSADDSGEEWTVDSARLGGGDFGDAGAAQPYSLAVTVGLDQGDRVMVDLSRASSAIAVTGSGRDAQQLVRAFVTELITGPVGRHAEVTLVGSAASAEMTAGLGLRSARLNTVATLEEALARGGDMPHADSPVSSSAVTQVFRLIEGSSPVTVQGRAPRLIVLDAAQFADEKAAVKGLDASDALLVLGDAADSGWRFEVGADGSLDTGPLGLRIDVHAGRLS